jgi:hypothetical protein
VSLLAEHYRAVNEADGHSTHCAWGAGADCSCGKHWTPCAHCGELVGPDDDHALMRGDDLVHLDCGTAARPVTDEQWRRQQDFLARELHGPHLHDDDIPF